LDLEDAFEEAELAERAEERRNNNNVVIMTTLYNNHPFYYNNNNYTVNPYRQTKTINYNSTRKESNFSNNNNINEPKSTYNNQKTCYRCGQKGHYYNHCPYSFKQLAEMEEKNSNESLNF